MWKPRQLTTLWASTACNRGRFTYYYYYYSVDARVHDEPWPLFYSFLIITQSVDSSDGVSVRSKAATYTGQHICRQTSMPRMGFAPTTLAFVRVKIVHALDLVATVIGNCCTYLVLFSSDISK
jgi:hypothetical protein